MNYKIIESWQELVDAIDKEKNVEFYYEEENEWRETFIDLNFSVYAFKEHFKNDKLRIAEEHEKVYLWRWKYKHQDEFCTAPKIGTETDIKDFMETESCGGMDIEKFELKKLD